MQLPLSDGRAVRMLQALLAAADPLDRMVAPGVTADVYEPLAVHVLDALRKGADVRRVVLLLSEHGRASNNGDALTLDAVVAFGQAACDWWRQAESRWNDPIAI